MEKEQPKIGLAILITAVVVGGAIYYFTNSKISSETGNQYANTSYNQTSKEYAVMSQELWSAMACSTWASKFDDQNETERLFMFGYEQGKKFLGAVRAEKITEEDWQSEVPVGISLSLAGPSDDFILGVISAHIQESSLN